ncbi:hypothetical protein F2P81_002402 [Scophthalmus maximus]|uniref:Uncharacterized protein n=1 Tax=Scophthalmus maximus TaxID=52904 RepID=A0A6A4TIN6_SCOMX|nr:hypothetical protein F2P81_002402 [Scophthalmus maximus]
MGSVQCRAHTLRSLGSAANPAFLPPTDGKNRLSIRNEEETHMKDTRRRCVTGPGVRLELRVSLPKCFQVFISRFPLKCHVLAHKVQRPRSFFASSLSVSLYFYPSVPTSIRSAVWRKANNRKLLLSDSNTKLQKCTSPDREENQMRNRDFRISTFTAGKNRKSCTDRKSKISPGSTSTLSRNQHFSQY